MREERTIIAATTHLRHAALADGVIVLDRGKLVAHGTHEELMTARAGYAELFTLQAQAYLDEVPS